MSNLMANYKSNAVKRKGASFNRDAAQTAKNIAKNAARKAAKAKAAAKLSCFALPLAFCFL